MSIATNEELIGAGIHVTRGGIERDLADSIVSDYKTALRRGVVASMGVSDTSAPESEGAVVLHNYFYRSLRQIGSTSINRLIVLHPGKNDPRNLETSPDLLKIAVNHQLPNAYQPFHSDDNRFNLLVHLSDEGAFDFRIDESDEYKTVELNAGGVVLQLRPSVPHRGRNIGDSTRYVAILGDG